MVPEPGVSDPGEQPGQPPAVPHPPSGGFPQPAAPYAAGQYPPGPYAAGPQEVGPDAQGPYATGPYPQGPYAAGQNPQGPYAGGPYAAGQYPPGPSGATPVPGGYVPAAYAVAPRPEPLPVVPQEYHQFYRAPAFRWWKPLVAVVLFALGWIFATVLALAVAVVSDMASGHRFDTSNIEESLNTPAIFAANNISLAACIPIAMLVSWLVYRQRPGWLSSITGRFRWGVFGRFFAIAAPIMAGWVVIQVLIDGQLPELSWGPDSLFLLVVILFTTPLQAAGEEYMNRGLLARSVGSWFGNRWVALAAATAVNGVVFMLLHGAGDPWLNAFYLLVAVTFTLLTWRTGGLEAAIVMHIVNNLFGELTLPFSPDEFSHLFDRQAGVAGPETLIQMGVVVVIGALLWWRASRLGLPRSGAPAAPESPAAPVVA